MLLITEHVTKPVKDISMKSLCTGEIAKLFVDNGYSTMQHRRNYFPTTNLKSRPNFHRRL